MSDYPSIEVDGQVYGPAQIRALRAAHDELQAAIRLPATVPISYADLLADNAKLREALADARAGFSAAYAAAMRLHNDEVLLTCGAHEARVTKALA